MEESTRRNTEQTNPESLSYKRVMEGPVHINNNATNPIPIPMLDQRDTAQDLLREYRKFVMSVASAGNKSKFEQIQQGCIGLSTESGELLDNLKKAMFQERAFDEVNAKEECGDMLFYMTELLDAIDSDIFECISLNQKKLTERYNGVKFDKQRSINRDLDKEREILENRKNPPEPTTKGSCESCAATDCDRTRQIDTACERFTDNRNYPIEPTPQKETAQKVACCGNCAGRLKLKGCSRYIKTHDDGCCIDHKFLSEGVSE